MSTFINLILSSPHQHIVLVVISLPRRRC